MLVTHEQCIMQLITHSQSCICKAAIRDIPALPHKLFNDVVKLLDPSLNPLFVHLWLPLSGATYCVHTHTHIKPCTVVIYVTLTKRLPHFTMICAWISTRMEDIDAVRQKWRGAVLIFRSLPSDFSCVFAATISPIPVVHVS